jgi:uncharacterized membrane protein YciS (DUF1049 family)
MAFAWKSTSFESKQRKAKPEEKRTKNKNREGEKVALAIQHTFATVFDFASCTGKFFISLCFAILIAWVLYIGQFNSLLLHTRVKLSPRKKNIKKTKKTKKKQKCVCMNKNNVNLLVYSLTPESGIKIPV